MPSPPRGLASPSRLATSPSRSGWPRRSRAVSTVGVALDVRSTASVDEAAAAISLDARRADDPRQQRRHQPHRSRGDVPGRRVARRSRRQPHRRLSLLPRVRPRHARGGPWLDRQYLVAQRLMGLPGRAPYAASKAGVVGLTHTFGAEWAGRGVRVNASPSRPRCAHRWSRMRSHVAFSTRRRSSSAHPRGASACRKT